MDLDSIVWALPGVLGDSGNRHFISKGLGSTGNYFHEFGEQVLNFGALGPTVRL